MGGYLGHRRDFDVESDARDQDAGAGGHRLHRARVRLRFQRRQHRSAGCESSVLWDCKTTLGEIAPFASVILGAAVTFRAALLVMWCFFRELAFRGQINLEQ